MAIKSMTRAKGGMAEREVQLSDIVIQDIRTSPWFLPDERWIPAVERKKQGGAIPCVPFDTRFIAAIHSGNAGQTTTATETGGRPIEAKRPLQKTHIDARSIKTAGRPSHVMLPDYSTLPSGVEGPPFFPIAWNV